MYSASGLSLHMAQDGVAATPPCPQACRGHAHRRRVVLACTERSSRDREASSARSGSLRVPPTEGDTTPSSARPHRGCRVLTAERKSPWEEQRVSECPRWRGSRARASRRPEETSRGAGRARRHTHHVLGGKEPGGPRERRHKLSVTQAELRAGPSDGGPGVLECSVDKAQTQSRVRKGFLEASPAGMSGWALRAECLQSPHIHMGEP